MTRMHTPPHPGAILADWLDGLDDMTITKFANHIHVTRAMLSRILHGHAAISPDMAIRLEQALGASREMWLGMQGAYDLWEASKTKTRPNIKLVARPAVEAEEQVCA